MNPDGGEPERILQKSRTAASDSTPNNDGNFVVQITQSPSVVDLWPDTLDALPEQALNDHVGDKTHNMGIDGENPLPENESGNESGYSGPSHGAVRGLIHKVLVEHDSRTMVAAVHKMKERQ